MTLLENRFSRPASRLDPRIAACLLLVLSSIGCYAATDDFNDGVDDGWTRYNPINTGAWTLNNGTYRIQSAAASSPGTTGPGRAGSLRASETYAQFEVGIDLVAWDNSLDQIFGLIARVGTPGFLTTRGYAFTYATRTGRATTGQLQILRVASESGTQLTGAGTNFSLLPNQQYRLVLRGEASQFTAKLFSLTNLLTPLVILTGTDSTYTDGTGGFFIYDNSSGSRGRADVTFDNFVMIELPPPLYIERDPTSPDMRLSWPDWATNYRLQRTYTLPAAFWDPVDNQTGQSNGRLWTFDDGTAPASFYRLVIVGNAPPSIGASIITLTPNDSSGSHLISTDSGNYYEALFSDGSAENGTFTYAAAGDNARFVLTPSDNTALSNINLTFTSATAGTYTSDTLGSGTFSVAH